MTTTRPQATPSSSIPLTEGPLGNTHDPAREAFTGNVLAVFTARFDVTMGNTVDWQFPEDFDLSGVEYQAIASGLHKIESDVIYFAKSPYYGVSVFHNSPGAISERGATMRAFGVVLAEKASLANVWVHGQLLKRLPTDPSRHELKEFMQKYHHQHRRPSALPSLPSPSVVDDNFPFFMAELGPQVFVLWKAALLRQRILFMTAPPVQEACNHVYNTCLLSAVPTKYNKPNIAKFYISVNEIPELMESTDGFGYVACTSDSIFETKEDLYDLLIKIPQDGDLARAHFHSVPGTPAPQHNAADFIRFRSAVRRIFDLHEDSNDLSRLLDRKSDFADAIGTATLQMLLWWYRSPRHHPNASQQQQNDENTSKGPSWARLFAGTNPVRKEEDQALLLEENEADATEINNNEVMHAVAARASTEEEDEEGEETPSSSRQDTSSLKADPLTQALTRYFESLSARLLSTLESMILAVDEDNQEVILTPQDLIELGLHPVADAAFVTALARLYFDRSVHVQEPDPLYLCKCGCCGPRKGGIQM